MLPLRVIYYSIRLSERIPMWAYRTLADAYLVCYLHFSLLTATDMPPLPARYHSIGLSGRIQMGSSSLDPTTA